MFTFSSTPRPKPCAIEPRWSRQHSSSRSKARRAVFRIVSIGSGPAIDIERAVERIAKEHRDRLQVLLLDLDQTALTAAEQRLSRQLAPHQIVCHRENLFRLPKARGANWGSRRRT